LTYDAAYSDDRRLEQGPARNIVNLQKFLGPRQPGTNLRLVCDENGNWITSSGAQVQRQDREYFPHQQSQRGRYLSDCVQEQDQRRLDTGVPAFNHPEQLRGVVLGPSANYFRSFISLNIGANALLFTRRRWHRHRQQRINGPCWSDMSGGPLFTSNSRSRISSRVAVDGSSE